MKKIWGIILILALFGMVLSPLSSAMKNESESNDSKIGILNQPQLTLTYENQRFIITNNGDEAAQNVRFNLDVKAAFFFFNRNIVINHVGDLPADESWEVPLSGLVFGLGPATLTAQASADNAEDSNKIEFSCFLLGPFIFGFP